MKTNISLGQLLGAGHTVTLLDSATQEYQYQMKVCYPPIITESEFKAVQEEKKKRSNIVTDDDVRIAAVRNIVLKRNNEFYGGNEREENNHLSYMCGNDF